jgi:hypothetical protein
MRDQLRLPDREPQEGPEVQIFPVPILGITPCCVPVIPGTQRVDAPIEARTELCGIDANWIVGMAPTCDVHMRQVAEICGWDWPTLVAEAGRDLAHANTPAEGRQRHTQEKAQETHDYFARKAEEIHE